MNSVGLDSHVEAGEQLGRPAVSRELIGTCVPAGRVPVRMDIRMSYVHLHNAAVRDA